jgi:predicted protein tyrosine phosphatase
VAATGGPVGVPGNALTHNVLFVCGKNRLRSPTAEHIFADWPGLATASAGTGHDADCPVSAELIAWADTILVMEAAHRTRIAARFQRHLRGKRVAVLGIPDDFEYMAPGLVRLLRQKVPRYLPADPGGS